MKISGKTLWFTFYLTIALTVLLSLSSCNGNTDQKFTVKNTYSGSESCKSCHEKAYSDWQDSHHDWSMKMPDSKSVLGDFNDVDFSIDGVNYHFFKEDGAFKIHIDEIDGSSNTYSVAYTFGVTPLQQYLVEFPGGKFQALRVSWDTDENKWFHQYAGQRIETNDWLHWTRGGQRWNTMCAECHSTNLKKNYNVLTDEFSTTYDEINVGCESCHGAGSRHINWAERGALDTFPKILVPGKTQYSQLNSCSGCHARRVKLTETMKPDMDFNNQFILQNITSEYYHGDGQILEEDYVFGSFVQTKMYRKNVKCSDCHNPHSLKLKLEGNGLCMQCHDPKYNDQKHHFHQVGSQGSMCIDCHMTGKKYMGNDFRRDHSFRVPRPDQSVRYGNPNACMDCHADKSNQWAMDNVIRWYGPKRQENYSDKLLVALNQKMDKKEYADLLQFIQKQDQPAIARATLIDYLTLSGGEDFIRVLIHALADSSASVRYSALMKFTEVPVRQRLPIALKHIVDTQRVVRIAAANLIVEVPMEEIEPSARQGVVQARNELLDMLNANADFPLGRLQLGDYYMRQDRVQKAIEHYEKALEMDYLLIQAYSNLATAYNISGKNEKAVSVLNRLIELEPEYGRAYYLHGLLMHELGNETDAINDLEQAIRFDAGNFRYYYNLSNMYLQTGKLKEAEETIDKGLKIEPSSGDGRHLLEIIRRKKGEH